VSVAKLRPPRPEELAAALQLIRSNARRPAPAKPKLVAVHSADCEHWCTPEDVLQLVRELLGEIDLDPCHNPASTVGALHTRDKAQDGLAIPWSSPEFARAPGRAVRVWVNPPYGRHLGDWFAHAVEAAADGAQVLLLVPARTDTAWWHRWVAQADAVCFWAGRITFAGAPAPAPFPSALIYYGRERLAAVERAFLARGMLWSARRDNANGAALQRKLAW
jgi:hypothetical protein